MKIGYPCINRKIGCKAGKTFRIKSYSEERLIETVENNLSCLLKILKYNIDNNILFFRITSDLVPFASHPVNTFKWQKFFVHRFREIGTLIKKYGLRISMHPDQFTLVNAMDAVIFRRSVKELLYHAQILDLMETDTSAKIQIHVGGSYGNKEKSIRRFMKRYEKINDTIKRRLVIENDDRNYTLKDCMEIHYHSGIPVLFDAFHHEIKNHGEEVEECFEQFTKTWKPGDGIPMADYSLQKPGATKGSHTDSIDARRFKNFLAITKPYDFDIMLEIKDKEKSALKAVKIARKDVRFVGVNR